jgi:hypothetical protein
MRFIKTIFLSFPFVLMYRQSSPLIRIQFLFTPNRVDLNK